MEVLSDRIGVILKYGKVMGSLRKRYFFINNKGILHYTDKDAVIPELLSLCAPTTTTTVNTRSNSIYNDEKLTNLILKYSSPDKSIQLNDCSISAVKTFLDDKHQLGGRSYFELFVKSRDYRSTLLFSWKNEDINSLHEYVATFRDNNITGIANGTNIDNENEEEVYFDAECENVLEIKGEEEDRKCEYYYPDPDDNNKDIFANAKDKNYMENVLSILEGKLVNQTLWDKDCVKIINPSSNEEEYEEAWVELENGSNYSGPVKNCMPHGYGKEYRPDGSLYTGYFYRGKWHGPGTLTNDTLDTYNGEFIDGCICGI